MPTNPEANRLNLEYYRKAAKALLHAASSGDSAALERIARHSPRGSENPGLSDALLTIAREQGFASWPRFKAFIVESSLDFSGLVTEFTNAALEDVRRAEEILGRRPEVAGAGLYPALVLGDVHRVERALGESPGIVSVKGGPRDWEPLLYVCFSRFADRRSSRAAACVETARALLARGSDPNGFYVHPDWPNSSLPCLYAATGLNNNPSLAGALLDAGASVDDSESLYHSTEHPDLACLRLLLQRGAPTRGKNALKHILDYEHPDGMSLLLKAGADPNELNDKGETALHWAIWRGRSAEIVAELLDAGANLDLRRNNGETAYAMAVQRGNSEIANLLARRGANPAISALDRFVGRCAAAGPGDFDRLVADSAGITLPEDYFRFLPEFASNHHTTAVRVLLAVGVPIDARGDMGATALHWACWKGYADLVELLIAQGAPMTVEDKTFHGTPPGWFSHGLRNSSEGKGDYPRAARLLLAAGAKISPGDIPSGDVAVDAVYREYGLMR